MRHDEIVEQIGKLTETTAELKSQFAKPKNRLERFKEYAGVISLLLSLATGFFALYSSFVAEPERSKSDAQAKLHDTLAQIVTLDQEYLKALQQGDPDANNGALESKRNILLQQAEDLASRSGVASAEDQLNLGNQYEFGSKPEAALRHFNDALLLAGKDPLMRGTADTRIGRLNFYGIGKTTLEEGRKRFEDAEQILTKPATLQTGMALVQSLGIRSRHRMLFRRSGPRTSGAQTSARRIRDRGSRSCRFPPSDRHLQGRSHHRPEQHPLHASKSFRDS